MAHDVDDKRALFVRVVDDIVEQIRTGKLAPGEALPTARRLAEIYDVASMTAQRALRELQQRGLTYAVVGKGTFVHPQARERTGIDADGRPITLATGTPVITDRDLNRRLAQFLLERERIAAKLVAAWYAKDQAAAWAATEELGAHVNAHQDLADDLRDYETRLSDAAGTSAQPVAEAPPRKRQTRRSAKP